MAKNNRGGLGRGLGALLGDDGSAEEEVVKEEKKAEKKPVEPPKQAEEAKPKETPKPEKVEKPAAEEKPSKEDPKEKANIAKDTEEDAAAKAARHKSISEALKAEHGDIRPYIEQPDNVVIKEIVERELPEKKKEPAPSPKKEKKSEVKAAKVEVGDSRVDISLIQPNPDQPRTRFDKEELEELSRSIKTNGLLQPILVRKVGKEYQIIAGERRWQASKLAGLKKVPITVTKADDNKAIELALIENIQRSNLNPIEEAYGYRRLMERKSMTQSELATAVSKGRSTIANSLRLLDLPEDAQQLLFEGKITSGHARAILSIPDKKGRQSLTEKLVKDKLSVREAESIARLLSGKKSEPGEKVNTPGEYRVVAKSLTEMLKVPVKVRSSKGKNKIEIEFTDETQLEELFKKISAGNEQ